MVRSAEPVPARMAEGKDGYLVVEVLLLAARVVAAYVRTVWRWAVPAPRRSLEGTTALVTGAGRGLGRALVLRLARLRGVRLVLWDIDLEACESVAREARQLTKAEVRAYACDVSDETQVARVAQKVRWDVGDVTLLINNAGVLNGRPFLELRPEAVRRTVGINLLAHFWTTQQFLPSMLEKNHGQVVAIASVAGLLGVVNMTDYSATKFGVRGFMQALQMEADEQGKDGVYFTTVCPVTMNTGLASHPNTRFPSLLPVLEVEVAAEAIVDGIRRGEALLTVPGRVKSFLSLSALAPWTAVRLISQFLDYATKPNDPQKYLQHTSMINGSKKLTN